MELNEINRLLFETLENISSIETSRVSMFDIEDQYSHSPFFRFKFKNKTKEDKIYTKIKNAIGSFKGNLEWDLVNKPESENFLILPIIFESKENYTGWDKKAHFISLYGESRYRKKIDESIDDIPALARAIGSCC